MIDIKTGKVVDIINSRDYDQIKALLNEYPNIELVRRDRSSTYLKVIKDAHAFAIKISDRFHFNK